MLSGLIWAKGAGRGSKGITFALFLPFPHHRCLWLQGSPSLGTQVIPSSALASQRGFFPTHSRPQQSLLCCWKGRLIPAHTWLTVMLLPQAELSCPSAAPRLLRALAGPRPSGISMGFHVVSSSHAQELGFSAIMY